MRRTKRYGSHIPMLVRVWDLSQGEVLELGTGLYSTALLYWLAEMSGRHVTSYETNPTWYERSKRMNTPNHSIQLIQSWEEAELERPWGVVLVDHAPGERRWREVLRLVDWADYIVLHDSNDRRIGYEQIYPKFRWVYHYKKLTPWTTVVSNKVSLDGFA
jgi:hypothetical protein